jgi:hypothetical protein
MRRLVASAHRLVAQQETAQKLLQTLEFEEKQRFENAAQSLAQLEETVQRRRAELLDAMSLRTAESRRSLATFLGLLGNGCHEVEKDFASISRIMSSEHGGDSGAGRAFRSLSRARAADAASWPRRAAAQPRKDRRSGSRH